MPAADGPAHLHNRFETVRVAEVVAVPQAVPVRSSVRLVVALVLLGIGLRLVPRPAGAFALGRFAVSPALVGYAAECKQYATDAAVAVGLFAAAAGLLTGRRPGAFTSPLEGEVGAQPRVGGDATESSGGRT